MDDSSNLCTFVRKVLFRVEKLFSPSRAIIPSRTGDLRLVSYFRNAYRAGWNFCLERQHGSATAVCANTFVDARQKFLSSILGANYSILVTFIIQYIFKLVSSYGRLPSLFFLLHFLKHECLILSVPEITQLYRAALFSQFNVKYRYNRPPTPTRYSKKNSCTAIMCDLYKQKALGTQHNRNQRSAHSVSSYFNF